MKIQKIDSKEMIFMIKKMAWNTFENTGNIISYLEFNELKNIEKKVRDIENGASKSKGDNYIRK